MARQTRPPEDAEEREVVKEETESLQRRSEGAAIYLAKEAVETYQFEIGQPVNLEFVLEDGSLKVVATTDTRGGFTKDELEKHAEEHGWTPIEKFETGDEWSHTYEDETGRIRIEVDSYMMADGDPLDNITIFGPKVDIDEELEAYDLLKEVADQNAEFRLEVRDSDGIWERYQGSDKADDVTIPDRKVVEQLTQKADKVTAQLIATRPSVLTSLEELPDLVTTLRSKTPEGITELD